MYSTLNFPKLSHDVLSLVTDFLTVQDINSLSSTCKEFHGLFSIKMESQQSNDLVENKTDADILYLSAQIQRTKTVGDKIYTLQCLKFDVTSKDQGWVKDCQSGSWIEAEFAERASETPSRVLAGEEGARKRDPLIYNYQVRDFQKKTKILHRSSFPGEASQVNVHLRSSGEGWEISCKQVEVQKFYSHFIKLSSKQLESLKVIFKKKTGRRVIPRR